LGAKRNGEKSMVLVVDVGCSWSAPLLVVRGGWPSVGEREDWEGGKIFADLILGENEKGKRVTTK
jgi:hypothetical protein